MTISAPDLAAPHALGVAVDDASVCIELSDGRTITAPLAWYPRLAHATELERSNWRLTGEGEGVHWPDLDEDLSVASLLAGRPSDESAESLARWLAKRRG